MRCIFLLLLLIAHTSLAAGTNEDQSVSFQEFTLSIGDRVEIGDYRAELVDIQSLKDGLVVLRVTQGSKFEEQRVVIEGSRNSFNGGAEEGGLTLTITDIFDEESAKLRVEYRESLGTPRKRAAEKREPRAAPNLVIEKSFDKSTVNYGEEVKVTVTVRNVGTEAARSVEVYDIPPLAEFAYIAGYPPKIKSELGPGETDSAVYVMRAVKEGLVKVPQIEVRYKDAKDRIKTNTTEPFELIVAPPKRPNLVARINVTNITSGERAPIEISIENTGQATATMVEVSSEVKPPEGLTCTGLDQLILEIPPGSAKSYRAEMRGERSGNYTIALTVSYRSGETMSLTRTSASVSVLEREYKYLYYLLVLPLMIVGLWVYKRYKEYKY
ncbi:MAG: CARDB domain-containing protein [Methanothrix sp.]